jgi:hypothetical protein
MEWIIELTGLYLISSKITDSYTYVQKKRQKQQIDQMSYRLYVTEYQRDNLKEEIAYNYMM